MNNALRQILSIPGAITTEEDANSARVILKLMEDEAEKYVASGVSKGGVVSAKISTSLTVKSIKIDHEKLAIAQSTITSKEKNITDANRLLATFLEGEILSALNSARNKILNSANKGIDIIRQSSVPK